MFSSRKYPFLRTAYLYRNNVSSKKLIYGVVYKHTFILIWWQRKFLAGKHIRSEYDTNNASEKRSLLESHNTIPREGNIFFFSILKNRIFSFQWLRHKFSWRFIVAAFL